MVDEMNMTITLEKVPNVKIFLIVGVLGYMNRWLVTSRTIIQRIVLYGDRIEIFVPKVPVDVAA